MNTSTLPDDARPGRARLRVADLERSLTLYRDLLGLRVVADDGASLTLAAGEEAELSPGSAARELLVLLERPGIARRPVRPVTSGLYHVALLVPTRRALGRALDRLRVSPYPLRGLADHAVSESVYLDDPDGNGLEIYADRPREEWQVRGGVIQMTVEPMDVVAVLDAGRERFAPWHGLPRETVVGHLHFTVSHLEPAVAFYRDVVGFAEGMRMPGLAAVAAGGYHHHLNLNVWAGDGAPPDSDGVAGLDSFELVVPEAAEREALARRLKAAGALLDSADGKLAARDPDGVCFEIT